MAECKRLFDFLSEQSKSRKNEQFLSCKIIQGKRKVWKNYTFGETKEMTDRTSQLLLNIGIQKDDNIALISHNRPEWNFVDMGIQQIGGVCVPMYPTISANDYEFIFNDAQIRYAFTGDEVIYDKVKTLLGKVPSLQGVYCFDELKDALVYNKQLPPHNKVNHSKIQNLMDAISEEDLATIIYTSGTTGDPKGVMLTHKNIVSNLNSVQAVLPFVYGVTSLSFLPLCHSFERIVFYAYLRNAIHIHYAESMDTIAENLKEVKPYCFTTVPRLLEKVYEKIVAKGNDLDGFKKKLFEWSMKLSEHYVPVSQQSTLYKIKLSIARKLIFSKWQEALGGNVHFIVTGAAAFQPRLARLFETAGIPIIEGYGLTETSPVLTVNRPEEKDRCIGTVGTPVPDVEVKIAEDGEIIARGPNIMKGYYKRPDLTAEVIDKDNWFHTGDIGEFVNVRFLRITDRKKELFKTSGGKYIAPQVIENKMKESHLIEQIMVVGESEKYISALIVPSFIQLDEWAKRNNMQGLNREDIVNNEKIKELIQEEVETYNQNFGKWEQIKKFTILLDEWSIEKGELTPTLKLKRKVIKEKFGTHIKSMYDSK